MRILFLNPVGTIGGAERVLLDVMASLRQAAPCVELYLATGADGPLVEAAAGHGVNVHVLELPAVVGALGESRRSAGRSRTMLSLLARAPVAGVAGWGYARRLRRLVDEVRPDVIHSNGIKFHLLTRLARLRGSTVVWHVHDFLSGRRVMAPGLRWAGRAAAGAIAISRAVEQDARRVLGTIPIAVVPNAVDTDHFAPGPGDGAWLDRLAGLSPAGSEVARVGLVATYAHWKGQDVFLRAAQMVASRWPERAIRFYVVGGPIYQTRGSQWSEAELRCLGADLLAARRLGFVGFCSETAEVYRALDVVVHASTKPEPFGLTIAEGMACGRAVIVAQAGGAAELFRHDHDAGGTAPGDTAALARAMVDLASDPLRRQRLGECARTSALDRFRRERLGPQILQAYHRFGVRSAALPHPLSEN